jgi:hypothetical protein
MLEVIARLLPEPLGVSCTSGDNQLVYTDPEIGHRSVPGLDCRINASGLPDYRVQTDEHGFRDELAAGAQKRIIVLGDSMLYGVHVDQDDLFTEVLQRSMTDLDVVNTGLSGTGTAQQLLLYDNVISAIPHDLVISTFTVHNDGIDNAERKDPTRARYVVEDGKLALQHRPQDAGRTVRELIDSTGIKSPGMVFDLTEELPGFKQLYESLGLKVKKTDTQGASGPPPDPIIRARAHGELSSVLLSEIARSARGAGREHLVVLIPSHEPYWFPERPEVAYFIELANVVRTGLEADGLCVYDMADDLRPYTQDFDQMLTLPESEIIYIAWDHQPGADDLWNKHWDVDGHRIVAGLIQAFLEDPDSCARL